tara:strand:+ start:628 stop:1599 length:972 start_codon:yes stop_codon:yes gene_type:complete
MDCSIPGGPSAHGITIVEVEGIRYDETGSGAWPHSDQPMWVCNNECKFSNPCNNLPDSINRCNEPGQNDNCDFSNTISCITTECAGSGGFTNPGDNPVYCTPGSDCSDCGIYKRPFKFKYLGVEYSRGAYYIRGTRDTSSWSCCDDEYPWMLNGNDLTGACVFDPPPSPPSPPPPPPPPRFNPMVDVSCAPAGTFVCYDDPTKGWNQDSNTAVDNAEGTAYECDVSIGPPNWNTDAGQCNDGTDYDANHNCQVGYDCTMCGVYYVSGGQLNKVWGTQCSDEGIGCISRVAGCLDGGVSGQCNWNCCEEYCDQFGLQGTGCPAC